MGIRVCLIAAALLLLSCCQGTPAEAAETVTPPADSYMPLVFRQPTLTPSATPTPEPTATPTVTPGARLLDGYYNGDVPSPGAGRIWFNVSHNGSWANDGAFFVRGNDAGCAMEARTFSNSARTYNGAFLFYETDSSGDTYLAELHCRSISSTQAKCSARDFVTPFGCGVSGVVVSRWH